MTKITDHDIDIIIPYFNSGHTIDETLGSIASQSFKNYKIIIINNNSSKEHLRLLKNSVKKYKFVNAEIKNYSKKVSIGRNFNRGLKHVKADFFCIMHADDMYEKNYLKQMICLLKKENEIAIFCDVSIINQQSKIVFSMKNTFKKFFLRNKDQFYGYAGAKDLKKFNFITSPTVFFNSKVIKNVGFFSENLNYTLDWDYWFRIIFKGYKIKYLKQNLFKYRIHSNQLSYNLSKNLNKYKEIKKFILHIDNSMNNRYVEYNPSINYTFSNVVIIFDIFLDLLKFDFKSVFFKLKYLISK